MRWTSLAEIGANLDPSHRMQVLKQQTKNYFAQAKIEQDENHHRDMISLHHEKMSHERDRTQLETQSMIEREIIAGKNALALTDRNHILGQFTQNSALIDDMIRSELKKSEEWSATVADTMRQLFVQEGDTVRQAKLKELEHRHKIDSMTLEFNCRLIEMYVQNNLMDARVSFDKACEVIFKLVERALGLGGEMMSEQDIDTVFREWAARDDFD